MVSEEKPDERTAEEKERALWILRRRAAAISWAQDGRNMEAVRSAYHRRLLRGEKVLMAWRRALWACYARSLDSAS